MTKYFPLLTLVITLCTHMLILLYYTCSLETQYCNQVALFHSHFASFKLYVNKTICRSVDSDKRDAGGMLTDQHILVVMTEKHQYIGPEFVMDVGFVNN